eukprot:SAG31_NODE_32846_length_351_cov_0.603175_1_plen_93_part_01
MLLTGQTSIHKLLRRYMSDNEYHAFSDAVVELRTLVETGNLAEIKHFLQEKEQQGRQKRTVANWCLDSKESSALILAARQFRPQVVEFLCQSG